MDGKKHSSEPNKGKPYSGDYQVVSKPDVDSIWAFPPSLLEGGYGIHNAQFSGHVGLPVHGLHRYSDPSNGASTLSANTGGSACMLNRDFWYLLS